MREELNQWDFVWLAYGVGAIALALLIVWAWRSMARAEARRDATRRR
ncbi:heme exporter protein CcmD [Porphyrobacter sp. ULC335]|jgi:heme exporter protein D|nr:heme exporter protein CcmD [Porphyrobacter sp. ULC335]UYV14478.1 heme exporter protein CcmD [Porphyrobacter sp. ULC335]